MKSLPDGFLPNEAEILSFLKVIKDEPHDETHRLVFADWLEERGDPRGTVMRFQCERDHTLETLANRFESAKAEILSGAMTEWVSSATEWVDSWVCFRGLLAFHFRESVNFFEAIESFSEQSWWPWTDALDFYGTGFDEDALAQLSANKQFDSLNHLGLASTRLTASGLGTLASTLSSHRLRSLDLNYNFFGDDGVKALADNSPFENVEILWLQQNSITAEGTEALVRSQCLSNLKDLDVGFNSIGPEGLAPLVKHFPFRELYLNMCHIEDEGAIAIARSEKLKDLAWLDVGNNDLSGEGLRVLVESPNLSRVRKLRARSNPFGNDGPKILADRAPENVRVLSLINTQITDEGVEVILKSDWFQQLEELDLRYNPISRGANRRLKRRFNKTSTKLLADPQSYPEG